MEKIAVFDINGTLYSKKSKDEFFKFVVYRKNYKLPNILQIVLLKLVAKTGIISHTQFKENFFSYLNGLPEEKVRRYAEDFWNIEFPFYFNQPLLKRLQELRDEGVKIALLTGGFELYTQPLLPHLSYDYFAGTRTEYTHGKHKILGEACKEEEKTKRLNELVGSENYTIVEAYSDDPETILKKAEKAFIVQEDGSWLPMEEAQK